MPTPNNGHEPKTNSRTRTKRSPIERLLGYGERDELDAEDLEVELASALRDRYQSPASWAEWWRDRFEGACALLKAAD